MLRAGGTGFAEGVADGVGSSSNNMFAGTSLTVPSARTGGSSQNGTLCSHRRPTKKPPGYEAPALEVPPAVL